MATKIIQVPMNEELLKNSTSILKEEGKEAVLVRQACERLLKQLQEEELDDNTSKGISVYR